MWTRYRPRRRFRLMSAALAAMLYRFQVTRCTRLKVLAPSMSAKGHLCSRYFMVAGMSVRGAQAQKMLPELLD